MSTKNLIASQRGTDDARADLGLSGDHVETLRALLDSLTSLKDESALAQGAPSIEIGSDGELRRRGPQAGAGGASFSKRLLTNESKRLLTNESKRLLTNESKRLLTNESKAVVTCQTKRLPGSGTKHLLTCESKRLLTNESKRDDAAGVVRLLQGLLGESGALSAGGGKLSLHDAYLVIPISLDDNDG